MGFLNDKIEDVFFRRHKSLNDVVKMILHFFEILLADEIQNMRVVLYSVIIMFSFLLLNVNMAYSFLLKGNQMNGGNRILIKNKSIQKIADTTDTSGRYNIPRSVHAQKLSTGSITLDGRLNEKVWQYANYTSNFTQRDPDEGAPATEKTKVAFLYGEDALYIGARMYSDNPSKIRAVLARRDNSANSEQLTISLDTFLDRRTAYSFAVTAAGVRIDYYQPRDKRSHRSRDLSYDPVWSARTQIDSLGWTAEMRIPFTQLRYSQQKEERWGLNIDREIPTRNEHDFWVMIPKDETGWASKFGVLDNINNLTEQRRIEFLPYVANDALIDGSTDTNNPFAQKVEWNPRIGGDFELGIGSNLTMDATVNPDFGQVEADPTQVNLTAFETQFEEKRPFFTKGQQYLQQTNGSGGGPGGPGRGSNKFFYSRRIGSSPSYHPDAEYVDMKQNTSILEATKITGRLPSGLSIGGLAALTGREFAHVKFADVKQTERMQVEPLTGYGVARLQQQFGPNSSTAGLILTGVRRDLNGAPQLSNNMVRKAYTGGTDWNLRFLNGKYVLRGNAGFSYLSGAADAISEIQQSSAHYYQRPDASHVHLDSMRTSLSGYNTKLGVSKRSGEHWLWEVNGEASSPGFDLNDIGIMNRTDQVKYRAQLTYQENTPSDWYHDYQFELRHNSSWNYGGAETRNGYDFQARITLPDFWRYEIQLRYDTPTLDDRMTRGGPLMGHARHWGIGFNLFTNRSANTNGLLFFDYDRDASGGHRVRFNGRMEFRTGGRWVFSISPSVQFRTDARQYLTTLDNGSQETYGKRYIFGHIDRKRFSTQFRVNYSFNPDLSVEWYAEPFTASGDYYNIGELPQPGSYKLRYYGEDGTTLTRNAENNYMVTDQGQTFEVDNPDFRVRSFKSNLVIRYQWRPGSTFYLVWQQNKFLRENTDQSVQPGDLVNAFGETGQNMLAIKFTYWIPVK